MILETAVAVIDILGFSELIKTIPLVEVVKKVTAFRGSADIAKLLVQHDLDNFARYSETKTPEIRWLQFSDSIVVYLDVRAKASEVMKSPEQKIRSLSFVVAETLARAMTSKIPLRGAISYGKCWFSRKPLLFIGLPILDAYKYEKKQKWAGAILAPGAEKIMEGKSLPLWIVKWETPMKCPRTKSKTQEMFCINWPYYILSDDIKKISNYVRSQKHTYVKNCLDFYNKNNKQAVFNLIECDT